MSKDSVTSPEMEVYAKGPHHRWDRQTKGTVAVLLLVIVALMLYQFRIIFRPLVLAVLLAFILNPVVDFLAERVGMHRGIASALIYFLLVLLMLGLLAAPVTAVPSIRRAIIEAQLDLKQIIDDINTVLGQRIEIAGFEFDLSLVAQELSTALRRLVESVAQGTLDLVLSVASGVFWVVFVVIVSFYLAKDAHRIADAMVDLAPPGYRDDAVRIREEMVQIWNAFLRGELLLGGIVGLAVGLVTTGLGLPYPWALGLTAGVLELIPNVGPVLASIPAILLALIQGSAFIPLGNFWFAVLVAGAYWLIQLVENNILVPRILGGTLDLHPLAVLIGALAGGQLVGILGVLLAAPTLATLRLLGRYVLHRLYDRDPFPPTSEPETQRVSEQDRTMIERVGTAAREHLQRKVEQVRKQYATESDTNRPADR